jgi:F-type H+-transporting ATPase subunit epsilon
MKLRVLLPDELLFEQDGVLKLSVEAADGSLCLLPRHVDFVTALPAGLLRYETAGQERFVALDEGILVKWGPEVMVSTRSATCGSELEELRHALRLRMESLDERERLARAALARLQASVVRGFVELGGAQPS